MNTVTFKSVLDRVARRMGLDPTMNVSPAIAAEYTEYIQERLRQGWRSFDWPDIVLTDKRQFRPDYDAGATYAAGQEALGSDLAYYRSVQANNTGHAVSDTAWWTPAGADLDRYVESNQVGKPLIGDPIKAYRSDPATTTSACGIPYTRSRRGVQFPTWVPPQIWLKYRLPVSVFSSVYYAAGTTYQAGDVRFYRTTGECYLAANDGVLGNPGTDGNWLFQPIPDFLADWVVHSSYADALREDGQTDKANYEEGEADNLLTDEQQQLSIQQGQTRRYKVRVGGRR